MKSGILNEGLKESNMKAKTLTILTLAGVVVSGLVTSVWATPPKMKMTTDIPAGIAIADKLDTGLGTLNFFDGVPDAQTAQKVYDNLDLQQAVQAYLSSIKIASIGSYDVYFGPKVPAGREGSWIQTIPGKGWNTILRLYGPLEPWFDKSWRPGDPENVGR